MQSIVVEHIPLVWCEPEHTSSRGVVIWLPGFSGTKESVEPQLRKFAEAGFIAIGFDPYQHGERRMEPQEELVKRITGNIRRYFWPILTLTAEEIPRIIDWAIQRFGDSGPIMIGGISMGGDIAVVAAGVDRRIAAVSACLATPDWLRPGSHEPPGAADDYALACYARRNPLTNTQLYSHLPAICFQCGELDTQVPPDGAERFIEALADIYRSCPDRLVVRKHSEVAHRFTEDMLQESIQWFLKN
ncbi:dienelactone hydrolase family protein [Paenibacillus mendelii]|uniref:Dienelactone hydrolase family protein n=1 Tax=Paenibacillus mendelii TaxID=206163 RepID=A0ABV6JBH0_9BACL|nr:alpha/beta fold hydrolase [Paenibacillus mendelii]MCQ6558621.1 dienelactone hydrolase family protein [Paenibacillus mendelii]